jgi:hypothetical protein
LFVFLNIQSLSFFTLLFPNPHSFRLPKVALCELYHLRHSLGGEDGKQISDQKVPVLLAIGCTTARLEAAKCNALALIGATTAPIDKGRVEAVHIEVLIIDEETLSYCSVTVVISL